MFDVRSRWQTNRRSIRRASTIVEKIVAEKREKLKTDNRGDFSDTSVGHPVRRVYMVGG